MKSQAFRMVTLQTTCTTLMVAAATVFLASCTEVLDTKAPLATEARVIVTGTSPVPLSLVTSTTFLAGRNVDTQQIVIQLIKSDTAIITLPLERIFAFKGSDRFYVRLANTDAASTASIRIQLLVDGKQVFNQRADMKDSSIDFKFFNFEF